MLLLLYCSIFKTSEKIVTHHLNIKLTNQVCCFDRGIPVLLCCCMNFTHSAFYYVYEIVYVSRDKFCGEISRHSFMTSKLTTCTKLFLINPKSIQQADA